MSPVAFSLDNLAGDDAAPLFCRYPQQHQPQPAHVEMDQHGTVSAGYSADPSRYGITCARWNGRTLAWSVSPCAKPDRLAALLREHAGLFERVHAGHVLAWDGCNRVGRLSDEARAASDDLERILSDFSADADNLIAVWTADEWLFSSNRLRDVWSGRALADAVADLEREIRMAVGEHHITGCVRQALLNRALHQFDADGGDGLDCWHVAALLAGGRITAEDASAWAKAKGASAPA